MTISSFNRKAMILVISAALTAISLSGHADPDSKGERQQRTESNEASHDKQAQRDQKAKQNKTNKGKAHEQQQQRLSQQQQQERIRRQRELLAQYRERIAQQEVIAQRHAQALLEQERIAHHRFQQAYYERLRQQEAQLRDDRYDYNNDPFYYTAPSYRYSRDGHDYETNQYGADALRQAVNNGYEAGLQAGRADKQDNWRFDYRQSFAYEDANYGYDGRYIQQDDYNHYFREGFQRGYDDGYNVRRQYGDSVHGADSLLGAVLTTILNLRTLD
jgi:hypothetical protein